MNKIIFPMKHLRVTQTPYGRFSHLEHTKGNYVDYPMDVAGKDGSRDWIYCPCEEMQVMRIYGVGTKGVNTIWLTSTKPVEFASGLNAYFTMMVIHPNDDDLKKIHVHQRFKLKEPMFREGTDGNATGNHLHISCGVGPMIGTGWRKNSLGKWVLTTAGGTCSPEAAFQIDETFTDVINDMGIAFKILSLNPYNEPSYIVNRRHHEYGKIHTGNEGVKWLQFELQAMGLYHDKIDGFYGPLTFNAVCELQREAMRKNIYHDRIDGSCGPLTRYAIKKMR